jgi:purine-binding chemotaxis protein CheW
MLATNTRSQPALPEPLVTFRVGNVHAAVPVAASCDVLPHQPLLPVPLAPDCVAGLLYWRECAVLVIDLRALLLIPPHPAPESMMLVVVEQQGERFALMVDGVGELFTAPGNAREPAPAAMSDNWRAVASGVERLPDGLLLVLDLARLLGPLMKGAA